MVFSILRSVLREFYCTGDYNQVVIPVPIPNTEVKHFRDENTLYGEDSSLPVLFKHHYFVLEIIKQLTDNRVNIIVDNLKIETS